MRALESFNSQLVRHRTPVVLDAAHVGRLISLSSAAVHGASRLARLLRQEAARVQVLASREMPADVVNFGSEVTYRDESTGGTHTVTLVLPQEADVRAGRISLLTPVGTALIGQAQGAMTVCEFPVGKMRHLTVLRVDQSPPDQPAPRAVDAAPAALGATA